MQQNDVLSSVECYGSINDDDEAVRLAEALEGKTQLKRLMVSFEEDATVNDESALALTVAIEKSPIISLTLIWQEFRNELHAALARCLMEAVRKSTTIIHLDLHSMVGEIEFLVGAFSKLQSLGLYDDWNPRDILQLGESLHKTSMLKKLVFHGVNLDSSQDLGLLSQGIANNHSITEVAFRECGISDDGVKAFHEHWSNDSQIQSLEWTSNVIQAQGALLLIEAASSHPALDNLHIMGNEEIGYDGLVNIALMLPNVLLKRLTLASCVIDTVALDPAFKEIRQFVGSLIAQGTKANPHLHKMDINGSGIYIDCPGMAEALDFYTACNRYQPLMRSVPTPLWCDIFANFGDDASLTYYFLKELPLVWPEILRARPEKKQRTES